MCMDQHARLPDGSVKGDYGNRGADGKCVCLNDACRTHEMGVRVPCKEGEVIFCGLCANDKKARGPCKHLGEATSERRECDSCTGKVKIKVFECEVFTRCTIFKDVGLPVCYNSCERYEPLAS